MVIPGAIYIYNEGSNNEVIAFVPVFAPLDRSKHVVATNANIAP